jgi:hypothetical protein
MWVLIILNIADRPEPNNSCDEAEKAKILISNNCTNISLVEVLIVFILLPSKGGKMRFNSIDK